MKSAVISLAFVLKMIHPCVISETGWALEALLFCLARYEMISVAIDNSIVVFASLLCLIEN